MPALRSFSLGLMILFAGDLAAAPQRKPEASSEAAGREFRILGTQRLTTLQQELNQAAAAGYRLLLGSVTSGTEKQLILRKSSDPTVRPEYLILANSSLAALELELNQTAARGFRLVPAAAMPNRGASGTDGHEIVLIVEKIRLEGVPFHYRLVSAEEEYSFPARELGEAPSFSGELQWQPMQRRIVQSLEQGFELVALVTRHDDRIQPLMRGPLKASVEHIAILEKGSETTSSGGPGGDDPWKRYFFLVTHTQKLLQERLHRAAGLGYRVFLASRMGFPEYFVILSRLPASQETRAYQIIATSRASTFERELNEAASRGFHPVGQALINDGEMMAILEYVPGEPARFQYRVFASNNTSRLESDINTAIAGGYEWVGMLARGNQIVVLRKKTLP